MIRIQTARYSWGPGNDPGGYVNVLIEPVRHRYIDVPSPPVQTSSTTPASTPAHYIGHHHVNDAAPTGIDRIYDVFNEEELQVMRRRLSPTIALFRGSSREFIRRLGDWPAKRPEGHRHSHLRRMRRPDLHPGPGDSPSA